jgi:tripartite-type tricarboxylate transporter receptor subunit TctC
MVKPFRRRFLHLAAGAVALPFISRIAVAQPYPARPVRIVVGFVPGQAIDIIERLIGQWLSERLGQQFFVEGAGGNIAAELVVRAPPDGYTLLAIGSNNMINVTLYENLNFDFIRDIAPVASIARVPQVMEVHSSFPAKTVPQFIAYARANPDKLTFASAGIGSAAHLDGQLRLPRRGIKDVCFDRLQLSRTNKFKTLVSNAFARCGIQLFDSPAIPGPKYHRPPVLR